MHCPKTQEDRKGNHVSYWYWCTRSSSSSHSKQETVLFMFSIGLERDIRLTSSPLSLWSAHESMRSLKINRYLVGNPDPARIM